MDSRRRAVTSTYVQHVPYQTPPHNGIPRVTLSVSGRDCWEARANGSAAFDNSPRRPSLWGGSAPRHWPAPLYIIIKGRPRGASDNRSGGEGREDLIWRRKTLGRTHYLCLAQIRTLNFAFQRWMRCRCRRQQYMRHTCRR